MYTTSCLTVFQIPELVVFIAQDISFLDLARSSWTCRTLSQALNPHLQYRSSFMLQILQQEVECKDANRTAVEPALGPIDNDYYQSLRDITALDLTFDQLELLQESICATLESIEVRSTASAHRAMPATVTAAALSGLCLLLDQSTNTLTSLTFPRIVLFQDRDVLDPFLVVLSKMVWLEYLTVVSNYSDSWTIPSTEWERAGSLFLNICAGFPGLVLLDSPFVILEGSHEPAYEEDEGVREESLVLQLQMPVTIRDDASLAHEQGGPLQQSLPKNSGDGQGEAPIYHKSKGPQREHQLWSLTLKPGERGGKMNLAGFLLRYLESYGRALQELKFSDLHSAMEDDEDDILRLCPRLQAIELVQRDDKDCYTYSSIGVCMAAEIASRDHDSENEGNKSNGDSRNGSGIQVVQFDWLKDQDRWLESTGVICGIVKSHSKTLRVIELTNCEALASRDIQEIISGCPNLQSLQIEPSSAGFQASITFADAAVEWACLNLRVLDITLCRESGNEEEDDDDEEDEEDVEVADREHEEEKRDVYYEEGEVDEDVRKTYAQIGRLTKLESLTLKWDDSEYAHVGQGAYKKDLTVGYGGCLAELIDLKNLEQFSIPTDVRQAEIRFMKKQWPKLKSY